MTATITIGTLTMNTEPHEKWSSRNPPVTGPRATATPAIADHRAIATARSFATVNTFVRIDSVAGMISAAPTPIKARAPMSWPALVDSAAARDDAPKITMPTVSAPLRPNRSPSAPKERSRPAKTSV